MPLSINERKELRYKLLYNLYDHYFTKNGVALKTTKEELQKDKEADLAYHYLENKHWILVERQGNQHVFMKPTVLGIDFVEENHLDRFAERNSIDEVIEVNNEAKAFQEW